MKTVVFYAAKFHTECLYGKCMKGSFQSASLGIGKGMLPTSSTVPQYLEVSPNPIPKMSKPKREAMEKQILCLREAQSPYTSIQLEDQLHKLEKDTLPP